MTAPTTTAAGDACHNAINAHAAQGAAAKVFNVLLNQGVLTIRFYQRAKILQIREELINKKFLNN